MAYKTLLFGTDDLFNELYPLYLSEVQRGNLDIIAAAVLENDDIHIITLEGTSGVSIKQFELAIISSQNNFYRHMKFLEAQGFLHNRIIDGKVFKVPNLDFPRLINEDVAYGTFDKNSFNDELYTIYPRIYFGDNALLKFGTKSYIAGAAIDGDGIISINNFSSLSWKITFELGLNLDHNQKNVGQYGWSHFD